MNITNDQIAAIVEIIDNLLKLPLPSKSRSLITKRRKLLNKLCRPKYSLRSKKQLIQRHRRQLLGVLLSVKKQLLTLLE